MSYMPLRSTIHVYQVGAEDRVYEATTDDYTEFWGVAADQQSGPPLELKVSEVRYKIWGSGPPPEHPTREHIVQYKVGGAFRPMDEIRGGNAAVEIFKKYGKPDELGYIIWKTGII